MENKSKGTRFKRFFLKCIVPILILAVIGGIWILKNTEGSSLKEKDKIVKQDDNEDFSLNVMEHLDLEKLKSYQLPIIIDFGADSCIPCKEMAPVLKELNEGLRGKVIIKFVDVWKYQSLAEGFPVEVIPTQFFFDKEGNPYVPSDPVAMQMQMYSLKDTNEHVYTAHQGGMTKEQLLEVLKEMGVE